MKKAKHHYERGGALVEFALASSAFFLLMFGIIDIGTAYYKYDQVSAAAKTGSRWAIVNTPLNCKISDNTCQAPITTQIINESGLNPAGLTTNITFSGTSDDLNNGTSCNLQPTVGCSVNVNLQYKFHFVFLPYTLSSFNASSQMIMTHQQ